MYAARNEPGHGGASGRGFVYGMASVQTEVRRLVWSSFSGLEMDCVYKISGLLVLL